MRVSRRQLLDLAYRGLRVVGVQSGIATDAARDVLALEETHGCGLVALHRILSRRAAQPDGTSSPLKVACDGDPDKGILQARGASGLLLGEPLVALAERRRPDPVSVTGLAQAGALEPALRRYAALSGGHYEVRTVDGIGLLSVDPGGCNHGPAWESSWTGSLSVELRAGGDSSLNSETARDRHPVSGDLHVSSKLWFALSEIAAGYLV